MFYPQAGEEHVEFLQHHGWLVVADAIDPAELNELGERCEVILQKKHKLAFDWAWEKGKQKDEREFKIVQSSASMVWPEITHTRFRPWMVAFASALMRREVEFWYDQYLAKPPRDRAPTYWHQDQAYWGRNLDDRGITCWMPLHDVDERNGCMHFIDAGHRDGVLPHRQPDHIQSDLLFCEPDLSRARACPIRAGSVTFHHSKMPHMTPANVTDAWRRAVSTHMQVRGSNGEGDLLRPSAAVRQRRRGPAAADHRPRRFKELRRTAFWRNGRMLAASLLGVDGKSLRGWGHMIRKPAHVGDSLPWHQDEAYWDPGFDYVALGCWMPLDPATVESGCMSFIPGSHRSEVRVHRHLGGDAAVRAVPASRPWIDEGKRAWEQRGR